MTDDFSVDLELLDDDGTFPNNPELPVLIYRSALSTGDPERFCRDRLADNDWGGVWIDGVYDFHHYHSTAHEFLGILDGSARLQLGGPGGIELEVEGGDALVLPAGTAHKNLGSSPAFRVLGAYPAGRDWDLLRGRSGERQKALQNIPEVPLPENDPLGGPGGPLRRHWPS